jgi:tight adherence protein C
MGDRSDVNGVKSFAALVIQTEALGVSIAQTLRTYSIEMRETRFLKAEEKALPAALDVIRTVSPALLGHQGGG